MPANPLRLRVPGRRAVSPVVAVLAVAAAIVVLAGAFHFLALEMEPPAGDSMTETQILTLAQKEDEANLTVLWADPAARWNKLEIKTDREGVRYQASGDREGGLRDLAAHAWSPLVNRTDASVEAGDWIRFCADGPDAQDVAVSIRQTDPGRLVGEWVLAHVPPC